jgi:hypothetical protein
METGSHNKLPEGDGFWRITKFPNYGIYSVSLVVEIIPS